MNPPFEATPGDHLLIAARWIEASLLGSIATAVAIIAIAAVGLAMLNGRMDVRRGVRVIIGCFVLSGAPVIASGLLNLGSGHAVTARGSPPSPALPRPAPKPTNYDPYAGAAVPRSR